MSSFRGVALPDTMPPGAHIVSRVTRVLVVDDNVDSAELMAEMLRSKGLEVVAAHAPFAALDLIQTFLPQVALLDIGLPEMDGYELARRIIESGVACQLIAITGYGHDADRARALDAGFAAHLVKPVTSEAVLSAMIEARLLSTIEQS